MSHPIRSATIHTFKRHDANGDGVEWMSRFHPYKTYSVVFSGMTEAEAIGKAEDMRADAIAKYEADCIVRQNRKEAAAKKKAAKEATA